MGNNKTKPWALITGAQGGIGKSICETFADNGYNVIATDISLDSYFADSDIVFLSADLQMIAEDFEYAESFYKQVNDITKGISIRSLINNGAIQILGECKQVTREAWKSSFNVNLSAPFFLSQLFIEDLERNKGSIVNISSIHATQTKRNFITYATTKAALSSLTRNMAIDLRDKVRVNAVEPAAVDTTMLKEGFIGREKEYQQLKEFHPVERIADPSEISELVLFLCSDKARFIHGSCIPISGGIHGCLHDPA